MEQIQGYRCIDSMLTLASRQAFLSGMNSATACEVLNNLPAPRLMPPGSFGQFLSSAKLSPKSRPLHLQLPPGDPLPQPSKGLSPASVLSLKINLFPAQPACVAQWVECPPLD